MNTRLNIQGYVYVIQIDVIWLALCTRLFVKVDILASYGAIQSIYAYPESVHVSLQMYQWNYINFYEKVIPKLVTEHSIFSHWRKKIAK